MRNTVTYHVHGRNVEIPVEFAHLVGMKTRKEIAAEYDIPVWMLNRRLKESNIALCRHRVLSIEEVVEVYLTLNWPFKMRQPTTLLY